MTAVAFRERSRCPPSASDRNEFWRKVRQLYWQQIEAVGNGTIAGKIRGQEDQLSNENTENNLFVRSGNVGQLVLFSSSGPNPTGYTS